MDRLLDAPFTTPRYEIINAKVQSSGDLAILTFNLQPQPNAPDS